MKEYYTIGEVAGIYDVTTDTLRYYDHIGLLKPWYKGENGYRYYSKAQFEVISTIMLLRSMGTPVETLKAVLDSDNPDDIRKELIKKKESIEAEIGRLKSLQEEADRLDSYILNCCYNEDVRIVERPKLWMFSKPFGVEDELDIDEILEVNRLAEKAWVTRASIVSTITKDDLLQEKFHAYDRYGYLSEAEINVDSPYLSVIPPMLAVVGSVKVSTLEHSEMDAAYRKLLNFAKSEGYEIIGDAIERNVLDLYGGNPQSPIMFFEISIPVRKSNAT